MYNFENSSESTKILIISVILEVTPNDLFVI